MIQIKKEEAMAKKERGELRQQEISRNLLKLDQWKKDIIAKKEKKEAVSLFWFKEDVLLSLISMF